MCSACVKSVPPVPSSAVTITTTPIYKRAITPIAIYTQTPTRSSSPTPMFIAFTTETANFTIIDPSILPNAPSGFSWKIVPEYGLAVLVPGGWFFKQKGIFDMNVGWEIVISKDNFDENGNFSTGMAIIQFASDNPDEFAKSLLTEYIDPTAITSTIDSWNSQINGQNAQNIKVNVTFTDEDDEIIQLSVFTSGSWVYLVILKSPSANWENVVDVFYVLLDHVTIIDE
jgi:hypothetical protein